MKREIKFRVWHKKDKVMVDVASINFWPDGVLSVLEDFDDAEPQFADSYELMQYTGMHDKNGKDIFEGDIVRCENDYEGMDYTGEVMFFNGGFCVWTGGFRNYVWDDMIPEIIGNIHENPELLEVDE